MMMNDDDEQNCISYKPQRRPTWTLVWGKSIKLVRIRSLLWKHPCTKQNNHAMMLRKILHQIMSLYA